MARQSAVHRRSLAQGVSVVLRQIIAVTWLNLANLPKRLGSSSVIVVGISGVTAVLVALLAMAAGFEATLDRTGAADQAIVLRAGSDNEVSSEISVLEMQLLASLDGVVGSSGELYAVVDMVKRTTGLEANAVLRGVEPQAVELREAFQIVKGRGLEPGKAELIAGRGAHREFTGIELGRQVLLRDHLWTIVGIFEAGGSAYESELWADLPVAQSAFRREGSVNSLRLRVETPDRIDDLSQAITDDPRLNVSPQSEYAYFAKQSASLTRTLELFGRVVAIIMAAGAAFAAINSAYSVVATRRLEIATLRALGFDGLPVVVSVMIEALALGLLGGVCGVAMAYLGFDGFTVSTLNESSASQLAFDFAVTPALLGEGLLWALALGAVGGLLPALRAARLPVAAALRG